MTDRLRRLDALFAEKVLGCNSHEYEADVYCACPNFDHNIDVEGHVALAHYTRSLDAAWEGATRFAPILLTKPSTEWRAWIKVQWGDHIATPKGIGPCVMAEVIARADHPAEALVLACLRAVGGGEEELA